MEDSNTPRTPDNQPSKKVELPADVEQHMRMATRMLYNIIVDYRKRHPEKGKPPEPTGTAKNESP